MRRVGCWLSVWMCLLATACAEDKGNAGSAGVTAASGGTGGTGALGGTGGTGGTGGDVPADSGVLPDSGAANTGDCCATHDNPGCVDTAVRDCVCAADATCCGEAWDEVCVDFVSLLGCGLCKADCCVESGAAGCNDPTVEACVCAGDPACCSESWDGFCPTLVDSLGCGTCM